MSTPSHPSLSLHGFYKSSCSGRVRIALGFKEIPFTPIYVNLSKQEQQSAEYAKLNPSQSVPTLVVEESSHKHCITQSVAALEYLEEAFPNTVSLLPPLSEPLKRSHVRSLCQLICADIQPVTSNRIDNAIRELSPEKHNSVEWGQASHVRGLLAYQESIKDLAGKYSMGDQVTMADVCLVPAIWNAQGRYEISLDDGRFRMVGRVYENLMKIPAFEDAYWTNQPDCPEEEKKKLKAS